MPLEDKLPKDLTSDLVNVAPFTANGHLYAVPYSNDYRIGVYNTDMFNKAGITTPPATFDELKADLKLLKDKGVSKYPLAEYMAAAENTSTDWFLLTMAMGGQLFDKDGQAGLHRSELRWLPRPPVHGGYEQGWLCSSQRILT